MKSYRRRRAVSPRRSTSGSPRDASLLKVHHGVRVGRHTFSLCRVSTLGWRVWNLEACLVLLRTDCLFCGQTTRWCGVGRTCVPCCGLVSLETRVALSDASLEELKKERTRRAFTSSATPLRETAHHVSRWSRERPSRHSRSGPIGVRWTHTHTRALILHGTRLTPRWVPKPEREESVRRERRVRRNSWFLDYVSTSAFSSTRFGKISRVPTDSRLRSRGFPERARYVPSRASYTSLNQSQTPHVEFSIATGGAPARLCAREPPGPPRCVFSFHFSFFIFAAVSLRSFPHIG